jgi:hypothetical protein
MYTLLSSAAILTIIPDPYEETAILPVARSGSAACSPVAETIYFSFRAARVVWPFMAPSVGFGSIAN